MTENIKDMLESIKRVDGVDKVVLVSRTGMFMGGDEFENQDTFSAMSAIVLGASETATSAIGNVEKIVVNLNNGHKLIITPAGKRGVLAVLAKKDVHEEIKDILEKLKEVL